MSVKANIWFRSLLLNASWSYEALQNTGFLWAILPVARGYAEGSVEARRIMTRHIERFGTHPYLAATIIGSVAAWEEQCTDGECRDAPRLKKALSGPYAALGDPFFWGALRPLAMLIGVAGAVTGALTAPLAAFFFFNAFHMVIRLRGFQHGFHDKKGAVEFLKKLHLPAVGRAMRWCSVIVMAVYSVLCVHMMPCFNGEGAHPVLYVIVPGALVTLSVLIKRGVSQIGILYGAALVAVGINLVV